jgi:sporulation integral membrane protein YlbJ
MLGAVGAGLLGNPVAGWLIACSHWIAVLATGFVFSVGGNRSSRVKKTETEKQAAPAPVMEALGVSIKKTVDTLWAVGGYIVLFSVVAGLLKHYNVLYPLSAVFALILRLIGLDPTLAQPLLIGAVEMTNGCSAVAAAPAALADRCAALAMLASFGGFCIQAQSMLFLSGVGLSALRFALAKTVQGAVAFAACRLLALLPAFNSALCMGFIGSGGLTAASALASSAIYAAGGMALFAGLAFVSGRASTRGSA